MVNHDRNFYVQHIYTLPRLSKLNEEIVQQLDSIFDYASPNEYRNSLIEVYHSYIRHEHNSLPRYFNEIATQMGFLTDFLKAASEEMNAPDKEQSVVNTKEVTNLSKDSKIKDLILLLAGEELKSCKFFSTLRSVCFDDAFYQTNLCNFILKEIGFEDESNLLLETYFRLLDECSKDMKTTNESVKESALLFYESLVKFKNHLSVQK